MKRSFKLFLSIGGIILFLILLLSTFSCIYQERVNIKNFSNNDLSQLNPKMTLKLKQLSPLEKEVLAIESFILIGSITYLLFTGGAREKIWSSRPRICCFNLVIIIGTIALVLGTFSFSKTFCLNYFS